MNEPSSPLRAVLIGAVVAALVTIGPVLLLEFDPPVWLALEALAALSGAGLGWLFTKLG